MLSGTRIDLILGPDTADAADRIVDVVRQAVQERSAKEEGIRLAGGSTEQQFEEIFGISFAAYIGADQSADTGSANLMAEDLRDVIAALRARARGEGEALDRNLLQRTRKWLAQHSNVKTKPDLFAAAGAELEKKSPDWKRLLDSDLAWLEQQLAELRMRTIAWLLPLDALKEHLRALVGCSDHDRVEHSLKFLEDPDQVPSFRPAAGQGRGFPTLERSLTDMLQECDELVSFTKEFGDDWDAVRARKLLRRSMGALFVERREYRQEVFQKEANSARGERILGAIGKNCRNMVREIRPYLLFRWAEAVGDQPERGRNSEKASAKDQGQEKKPAAGGKKQRAAQDKEPAGKQAEGETPP